MDLKEYLSLIFSLWALNEIVQNTAESCIDVWDESWALTRSNDKS
jgi:hypothetical protein